MRARITQSDIVRRVVLPHDAAASPLRHCREAVLATKYARSGRVLDSLAPDNLSRRIADRMPTKSADRN